MDEELNGPEMDFDDIVEAFMKSDPDEKTLSGTDDDNAQTETDEETPEVEEEETEEDEEGEGSEEDPEDTEEGEEDEEAEPKAKAVVDDEAEVGVIVDGKEVRVSVKDLKRLYGQEASLTQKSQSLAESRKAIDAQGLYIANMLQTRLTKAEAVAAKYKDVDLFRASRELEPDEFDALRAAKENAESEVIALQREGAEFIQRATDARQTLLKNYAKESLKEITKAIPDWNDELYGKIRTYAVSQGMESGTVNEIVEPAAIIMMHKAYQFDQAQKAKETVTKKVTKTPTKAARKAETATDSKGSKLKSIRNTATATGDIDDVTELFMAAMK